MNSDDESFEKHTEEDNDCESDKENIVTLRTKPEQIDKIVLFLQGNTEQLKDKKFHTSMWERLSEELNDIGPPKRTVKEWKRIWSVYKYNNRKRFPHILVDHNERHQGDPNECKAETENLTEANLTSEFQAEIVPVDTLSSILDQQKMILEMLSLVLNQGDPNKCNTENLTEANNPTEFQIVPVDTLSLILDQQKMILEKLDKHEGLLNEIVKKRYQSAL